MHDTKYVLSDSSATSHFSGAGTHVINKTVKPHLTHITLPDECNFDIPWLRDVATQAHIVPGLTYASLLMTAIYCDARYMVTFDAHICCIWDNTTPNLTSLFLGSDRWRRTFPVTIVIFSHDVSLIKL